MKVKGGLTFFCEYQIPHTKYEDNSMLAPEIWKFGGFPFISKQGR